MKQSLNIIVSILVLTILAATFSTEVMAAEVNHKAYLISKEVELIRTESSVEVELWINADTAFSSADFGIKVTEGLQLMEVVYNPQVEASKVGILEKNGIQYFGFYGKGNYYKENMKMCTLRLKYTGNVPAYVSIYEASTTSVTGPSDVKKQILTVEGQLKVTRQAVTNPTEETNNTNPPTGSTNPIVINPVMEDVDLAEGSLPLGPVAVNFIDIKSSWAEKYITYLTSQGIIKGISSTRFAPEQWITRGDFTKLVVAVIDAKGSTNGKFTDVKPTDYYYTSIMSAKSIGLINGYNQQFFPKKEISREDMMVVLTRSYAYKNIPLKAEGDLTQFTDLNQLSAYAKKSVALMVGEGLIKGHQGKLRPKAFLTRAEAAKVLYDLYVQIHNKKI